jgi:hypothetical protein
MDRLILDSQAAAEPGDCMDKLLLKLSLLLAGGPFTVGTLALISF